MKTLKYSVQLDTSKEAVWFALTEANKFKQWAKAFSDDSHFDGEWKLGSSIRFLDANLGGTKAIIEKYQPCEIIHARHVAIINKDGSEDTESDVAKSWNGTTESYTLHENEKGTLLEIDITTQGVYENMFNEGWERALEFMKEICEDIQNKSILISRNFNIPKMQLWKMFTESNHIEKWFGPEGFSTKVKELDFRVGGKSEYVMTGPDGSTYPSVGFFTEINPQVKFTSTDEFGEDYKQQSSQELPEGMVITTLFEELDGKSRLSILVSHPTNEEKEKHEKMGVVEGWNSSLDCLEDYLKTLK